MSVSNEYSFYSRSAKDKFSEEIIKILPVKCTILVAHSDFKVQKFTSRAFVTLGMPPSFNEPSACQVSKTSEQHDCDENRNFDNQTSSEYVIPHRDTTRSVHHTFLSISKPPQTSVKSVQIILSKFLVQGFPELLNTGDEHSKRQWQDSLRNAKTCQRHSRMTLSKFTGRRRKTHHTGHNMFEKSYSKEKVHDLDTTMYMVIAQHKLSELLITNAISGGSLQKPQ